MKKEKKPFSLTKEIVFLAVSIVVAVALIVGTYFALIYESVINVFFGSSDYSVTDEELDLCQDVEAEGIVLLKNENNALPLSSSETSVALFGQDSVDFMYGGAGSGSVDTSKMPSLKDSMEAVGLTVNSTLWNFYTSGAGRNYRKSYPDVSGSGSFEVNEVPRDVYTSEVISSMNDNVAIVSFGRGGGESSDLPTGTSGANYNSIGYKYLELDKNELDCLALACEHYSKVIVLINSSNAMELGFLDDPAYANVKAALWVGAVGDRGIYAIGEVLTGKVNPSGRLSDTYAYDSTSAPSYQNFGDYRYTNSDTDSRLNSTDKNMWYIVYEEGIYVGYRYYETRYEDSVLAQGNATSSVGSTSGSAWSYENEVQYPFGYGLSYTTFEWSDYTATLSDDGLTIDVTLTVANKGSRAGKDVVELYADAPYVDGGIEKAAAQLVGYYKTGLIEAGESEEVELTVNVEDIASYDYETAKTYVLDAGEYYLAAGRNVHDALNNILLAKGKSGLTTVGDASAYTSDATLAAKVMDLDSQDATTFSVAQSTGYEITNQLDNADVNYYEDESVTYLSRSDWEETFPTTFKDGKWQLSEDMVQGLLPYGSDASYDQEAYNNVYNDGSSMPTFDSTATSYVVSDLVGVDYDDTSWADIVKQLSVSDATRLVRLGGYSTIAIDSIELPKTQDKDGPSGISGTLVGGTSCMAWPVEVVFASTWNDELIEEVGEMIGNESIASETAGWYAPAADIHRSPYSGRNFEYYSEDGFLSGKIGAAEMRGVRSRGVIAYMKHFALNDQETNRYGGSMFANEQAIREVFLKGFEYIARDGGATAAMASMNRIGLVWSGSTYGLMTEILRNEWGFRGMVITDQASVSDMLYQDMPSGLWAGTDLWLNTNARLWSLSDYTSNATVMSNVQKANKNIVYAIANSNAVSDEYSNSWATWKILLVLLDVVVFAACACGIVIPTVFFVRDRMKGKNGDGSDGGDTDGDDKALD